MDNKGLKKEPIWNPASDGQAMSMMEYSSEVKSDSPDDHLK